MKQSTTIDSAPGFGLPPTHEQISRRAEELWRKSDCPAGRDQEFWLQAERELQPAGNTAPVPARSTGARRSSGRVGSNGGSAAPLARMP